MLDEQNNNSRNAIHAELMQLVDEVKREVTTHLPPQVEEALVKYLDDLPKHIRMHIGATEALQMLVKDHAKATGKSITQVSFLVLPLILWLNDDDKLVAASDFHRGIIHGMLNGAKKAQP